MLTATEAFGAAPLNGAANARSVSAGSGSGLSRARAQLGGGLLVWRLARLRWRFPSGRCVALARPDLHALAPDLHLDPAESSVALLVLRVVAEDVIRAVVGDDALPGPAEVVAVDRRVPASVLGEAAEAHLRETQFVLERLRAEIALRIVREPAACLDRLIGQRGEAARIDRIDAHVRPRGRRDDLTEPVLNGRGFSIVEVVDVVVDALAQVHDRFPPPVDAAHVFADVPERIERRPGVVAAFLIERIADPAPLPAVRAAGDTPLTLVLVQALERGRAQLAAHEAVHAGREQPLAAGELLSGFAAAARVDDSSHVVGSHRLLDELPRRAADQRRAKRGRL